MSSEMIAPVQMALLKVGGTDGIVFGRGCGGYSSTALRISCSCLIITRIHAAVGRWTVLYRAVDFYLEALNYHKVGAETCKSAAHNPRFSPSVGIQILRLSNKTSTRQPVTAHIVSAGHVPRSRILHQESANKQVVSMMAVRASYAMQWQAFPAPEPRVID